MLKRILTVSIIVAAFAAAPAFSQSWGIGPLFRGSFTGAGFTRGDIGISVQSSELPFTLGVDISTTLDQFGATADWYSFDDHLTGALNYYFGPGVYASVPTLNAGLRAPIGVYMFPVDFLEIFAEVAPSLGIISDDEVALGFGVQPALGLRFWF